MPICSLTSWWYSSWRSRTIPSSKIFFRSATLWSRKATWTSRWMIMSTSYRWPRVTEISRTTLTGISTCSTSPTWRRRSKFIWKSRHRLLCLGPTIATRTPQARKTSMCRFTRSRISLRGTKASALLQSQLIGQQHTGTRRTWTSSIMIRADRIYLEAFWLLSMSRFWTNLIGVTARMPVQTCKDKDCPKNSPCLARPPLNDSPTITNST